MMGSTTDENKNAAINRVLKLYLIWRTLQDLQDLQDLDNKLKDDYLCIPTCVSYS